MPLPISVVSRPLLSNFACKFQPETPNPKPHSFVADINSTFVQNIFNLAITERIPDVKHHCQADNFGRSFKVFEQIFVGHSQNYEDLFDQSSFSDNTIIGDNRTVLKPFPSATLQLILSQSLLNDVLPKILKTSIHQCLNLSHRRSRNDTAQLFLTT